MSAVATEQGGRVIPLPEPPGLSDAEQLASLLGFTDLGLGIDPRGTRIVGHGAIASADIKLTNGTIVTIPALAIFASPSRLAIELCAQTGAQPKLKAPQALKALSLLRGIADVRQGFTADQLAREWGQSYLQAAEVLDLDMNDQAERWAAFCRLDKLDPYRATQDGRMPSIAAGSLVLRDYAGTRLVRAGWFRSHVKAEGESASYQEIAHRMERVGWSRRGASGRIKATRPGFNDRKSWNFYEVPEGWEDQA